MSISELRAPLGILVVLVVVLAVGLVVALASGCTDVTCGPNTIKQDDVCVAQADEPGADCGPGTVWNATSGRCENSIFEGGGVCGENTIVIVNDAGIHTCVGTGSGTGDCSQPLPCPAPSANNLTLCGRVYTLEESTPLDDGDEGNGEPFRGVEVRVYDPIAFIGDTSSPPLLTSTPDACGRFVIADVKTPISGYVAVATDDLSGNGSDIYVLTGIAAPATAGATLSGLRAWTFLRATDQAWSTAAGLAAGTTFSKLGVYIPIFLSGAATAPFPATPTAGVTIAAVDNSGVRSTHSESDYYFDDSGPLTRHTLSASKTATGTNGTGVYLNGGLGQYSGVGGAPSGSCWAKDLAAGPLGGAYVQERTASPVNCP